MTQARRARARPSRLVVPLVIAAVLLGVGVFAAIKIGSGGTTAGPEATPTAAATGSAVPSTTATTATPTTPSSAAPTPAANAAAGKAKKALTACQAGVRAADLVLADAKTGVGHWSTHVQAQTDANAGKISLDQMRARFKQTRLAGPADQRRYHDALAAYADAKASCATTKGADRKTATVLRSCRERAAAQRPVLAAAAAGMQDWKNHLAAMQRNSEGHVRNPQGVWISAWKAAPLHINAYKRAVGKFATPHC